MKQVLLATIAALTLSGCTLPDLDVAGYTPRNSSAATAAATTTPARPASPYEAGQASENTGDYSNYF